MIGIINYGLGNVDAFINVYNMLGKKIKRIDNLHDLKRVNHIIIPGVGAFDHAINLLKESELFDLLNYRVTKENIPTLGVCIGMQIMANTSEEGNEKGLGWIPGSVLELKNFSQGLRLPHMGWNSIQNISNSILFKNIVDPQFYFLHSYFFNPEKNSFTISETKYGINFSSAINYKNIFATQFHPEKSHKWGMELLKNFASI